MYEIVFTSRASREFKQLTPATQERLAIAIDRLSDNPRQSGIIKLKGQGQIYRIRIGDWRVIYKIVDKDSLVFVGKVVRRSEDTYRDLDEIF